MSSSHSQNQTSALLSNFLQNARRELLIAGIFLLTYVPTLCWMWERWFARDSYYSHGILVPFVSGFLIWQKREELQKTEFVKSNWAVPLIVAGIIIHILSSVLRVYFTSGLSMMIVLFGLVLYIYGKETFNKIIFPLAFLLFMIPMPMVVITNISFRMKVFAAQIAAYMLNNMRLPAIREGSIIKMRHAYVIVDDVCSGLRSLISLTALGAIFAYWMKSGPTKKIILFLSTIPIAIITNVIRIIFLSFISEVWGPEYATGFIHDFSGFMVFAIAFVLLFAVGKLLE